MAAQRRLSTTLAHLGNVTAAAVPAALTTACDEGPSYLHRDYSTEEIRGFVETLQTDGWVVLPECIEPELVPRLVSASDRLMVKEGDGAGGVSGIYALSPDIVAKDSVYWDVLDNRNLLGVVRAFLGEDFLLNSGQTRNLHPGCPQQFFHADDDLYRYTPELQKLFPRPLPVQLSCTVAIALTDFTPENGASWVYTGSHQWPETPEDVFRNLVPEIYNPLNIMDPRNPTSLAKLAKWVKVNKGVEPIQTIAKAGSVVLWAGGTWHGAGSCSEDAAEDRASVIFNCARGVLRTQTSVGAWGLAALPYTIYKELPLTMKRLLGCFPAGGGRLGGTHPPANLSHDNMRQILEAQVEHKKFTALLQDPAAIAAIAAVRTS